MDEREREREKKKTDRKKNEERQNRLMASWHKPFARKLNFLLFEF